MNLIDAEEETEETKKMTNLDLSQKMRLSSLDF